jgi:PEGA domain-containing protein
LAIETNVKDYSFGWVALEPDPDDAVIAAAEAAASWAHARRAKWTRVPLHTPAPAAPDLASAEIEFEFESHVAPAPAPAPAPAAIAAPPPIVEQQPPAPPLFEPAPRAAAPESIRVPTTLPAPLFTWLPRLAGGAALVGLAAVGIPYVISMMSSSSPREKTAPRAAAPAPEAPAKKTGALSIESTPAGARVIVDGKARGVTPLKLDDVAPGRHEVTITGDAGAVKRTVTVTANSTSTIEEAIFSGWIAVYSPFEVAIDEKGRMLRPDERNQFMLPPGEHELRFTNRALGFEATRQVEVKPGEGTTIRLTPDPSRLSVTASEPAEVWVDGARAGETPLATIPISLGTHDVVVRKTAGGGERRVTITVGTAPYTLNVDFSRP